MPRKKKPLNAGPAPELTESDHMAKAVHEMREKAAEYFEAGILLFTREEEGETRFIHTRFGNQFAIKGMIEAFMENHMEPELSDTDSSGNWLEEDCEDWEEE
jgi:hypothetical protein